MSDNNQFSPDADGLYTMEAAKKLGTPGLRFRAPTGSIGTILPNRSVKGKLQASMTCTAGGPDHVREASDWHQCGVSPEMKSKTKKKKVTTTDDQANLKPLVDPQAKRTELEQRLADLRKNIGLEPRPVRVDDLPESDETVAEVIVSADMANIVGTSDQ